HTPLVAVGRNVPNQPQRPVIRNVQTGVAVLVCFIAQRVLGEGNRAAAQKAAEDLVGISESVAKRVGGPQGQLVLDGGAAQLELQTLVIGVGGVGALPDDAQVAVDATNCSGNHGLVRWAGSVSREFVREYACNLADLRVGIDRLEKVASMVPNVTGFGN